MLSKTRCPIGSKKAIFNRLIKGGPAPQKCYARVWPGHRVHIPQCTMRFRQWRIGIRVFGTFALILWVLRSFQVKMLLSLSNSLPFAWISLVKLGKNSKNSYFSDFEPIFLLFGGVCSKRDFSKKKFFLREGFFETNLDLNKHPQQVF